MLRRLLLLLVSCLLVVLIHANVPVTMVHAAPVQQQNTAYQGGIVNATANIRSGPGLTFAVVGQARAGQAITLVACNEDCSWLQLDTGNWIAAFLVDLVSTSDTSNADSTRSRADDLVLNEPSQAALEIVTQILSYIGLPQSFEVFSANIYNAAALMANGRRVILYDPQLIADIENITNHDWPAVSILAHEIGHHLAGHTLADAYNREFELEADYFSGFILYKMGASLQESQAVMNLLRDHPDMTDHPPQAERLVAIANGWRAAERQETLAVWQAPFSNFEGEAAHEADVTDTATVDSDLWRVLRQVHNQHILSEHEILSQDEEVVFAIQGWGLGLQSWAATASRTR